MKKILLIVSLCLLLSPVFAFASSIESNLYYGLQQNSEVRQLQEFLIDKGFLSGNSTGNFFSLTLKAVKAYQTSAGINSTGYVGVLTRTAINNELAISLLSSNQEATNETGTIPPTSTQSATTNDVVKSLQDQIALLLQQVQAMQTQQTAIQQTNQQVQQLQQTVQQQSQIISQIQQNTQQIAQNTCTTNWQCGFWNTCLNSTQTRTCTDLSNCGTNADKPILTQSCTMIIGELTLEKNVSYVGQSVVSNTSSVKIGSYIIQNQRTEPMKLTSLSIHLTGANLSGLTISGINLGSSVASADGYTFSANDTMQPSTSKIVNVFADVGLSNAPMQTAVSVSSIGIIDNVSFTSATVSGQTITVAE